MTISQALERIAPSRTTAMTDRAFELRAAGRDIVSLSVGEPDFATPPHVIAAAHAALDAGDTRYTAVPGTQRLREAAALHYARDLGIALPASQVIVSAGGKQAIFHALLATLDPAAVILGGGVARGIGAAWWRELLAAVGRYALPRYEGEPPIELTVLGDDASLLGAALWATGAAEASRA